MSTPPDKSISEPRRMRRQESRRHRRTRHRLFRTVQVAVSHTEDAFWRQLEEQEEGRLAQEADHLFDTSFAWAA